MIGRTLAGLVALGDGYVGEVMGRTLAVLVVGAGGVRLVGGNEESSSWIICMDRCILTGLLFACWHYS